MQISLPCKEKFQGSKNVSAPPDGMPKYLLSGQRRHTLTKLSMHTHQLQVYDNEQSCTFLHQGHRTHDSDHLLHCMEGKKPLPEVYHPTKETLQNFSALKDGYLVQILVEDSPQRFSSCQHTCQIVFLDPSLDLASYSEYHC